MNPTWTKKKLEEKTDRSKFTDEIAINMLPKKQNPVFPTPPHTPPDQLGNQLKRCSPCTNEVGAKKAKKSRRACYKCEKPTCQTHSLTICKFCAQNSAF